MIPTFSERVKEAAKAAKENGHSVANIAEACGISASAVYQWLDGTTKSIDGANLVELAEMSGYEAMWIAKGKGKRQKKLGKNEELLLRAFAMFSREMQDAWLLVANDTIVKAASKETAA